MADDESLGRERQMAQEQQEVGAGSPSGGGGSGASQEWTTQGGDDEELDASSDVEILRRVWSNEKAAPEILPYEALLVERVQEQVLLMEENIAAFATEISDELMLSLYRMDVNRTLFLLRSYLRTRLSKIEMYPVYITRSPELFAKLSDNEQDYAYRYAETVAKHLEQSALTKLPDPYQSMLKQTSSSPEDDMLPMPHLDTFVFCKSKRSIGAFQIDDKGDVIVDLMKDDLHILRYKPVRSLVEMNRIDLI